MIYNFLYKRKTMTKIMMNSQVGHIKWNIISVYYNMSAISMLSSMPRGFDNG
jgi:hypothetical protein